MTVRSAVLVRFLSAAGGWSTVATVPAGHTWILKQVDALNQNAAANQVAVDGGNVATGISARTFITSLATGESIQWQGWLALEEGDILRVFTTTDLMNVWVSGADLLGVA